MIHCIDPKSQVSRHLRGHFAALRVDFLGSSAARRSDWVAVGRRIRGLRGFDMTQAEFARAVGVTQGHLSSLERGERQAGAAVLLAISREFGKSVDWLLTGKAFVDQRNGSPKIRQYFDNHFPITGGLRAERMGIVRTISSRWSRAS